MGETELSALEKVLSAWQQQGATVAVSCVGSGMHVVFTGRLGASRKGRWTIGNGRVGLVFDIQYASGRICDPALVPAAVRESVGGEFAAAVELLLETGDELWFGELRHADTAETTA